MDEQEVHPGQFEFGQALLDRALEIAGRELVPIDFRGDEDILALEAGRREPLAQPFPDPFLVAVALRRVEVAIAEPQRRLDGVDANLLLQGHGAEPDRRDAGAIRFNNVHSHVSLAAQPWKWRNS